MKYKYEDADEGFWVHNHKGENDLVPFYVPLPKPPEEERVIHGYSKNPIDQVFEREVPPHRLENMYKNIKSRKRFAGGDQSVSLSEMRDEVLNNRDEYQEEVEWIKMQWYHFYNGKWFYIKGKKTFITGDYWFYLNYFKMEEGGDPEYRDKDRRKFAVIDFIYNETMSETGQDMGRKLHLGINELAFRRSGKSMISGCMGLKRLISTMNFSGSVQGMDADNAHEFFKNFVVYPFRNLKWWIMPMCSRSIDPESALEIKNVRDKIGNRGVMIYENESLDGKYFYAKSADKSKLDKHRLNWISVEEPGKTEEENVYVRHSRIRECVAQGAGRVRIGFLYYTTTVEEGKRDAMKNFQDLCKGSHYDERKGGVTLTGLVNMFFPADDGMEGFIDKWGMSMCDEARSFIMDTRKEYILHRDFGGLANFIRKFPLVFRECFTPSADDVMFDRKICESRISELTDIKEGGVKQKWCNLEWVNGFGSNVRLVVKDENEGMWRFTQLFSETETNKRFKKRMPSGKMAWSPHTMTKGIVGSDTFQWGKKRSRKKSKGGISAFLRFDPSIDNPSLPVDTWKTHRFVATFENKQEEIGGDDKFAEEVLKACIYLGFVCYPETNIRTVWQKFEEWGYDGYLYYDRFIRNGKLYMSETPGYVVGSRTTQELFACGSRYLDVHGHRENHIEILQDMYDIRGVDDLTNFDRLASVLGCLKGIESSYGSVVDTLEKKKTVGIDVGMLYMGL